METLLIVGKVLLVLFAISNIALPLYMERGNYGFIWQVWKRFRIGMFLESIVMVFITIFTMITLWDLPILKYGWANLFFSTGGNVLVRPIIEGSETTSMVVRVLVPLFFIVFTICLPFLAHAEERLFRKGYTEWKSILRQSIKFGLIHCTVGIPLGAGLALAIPGFFFGYKYKRAFEKNLENYELESWDDVVDEAVMVSTTYHTMYNTIIFSYLIYLTVMAV